MFSKIEQELIVLNKEIGEAELHRDSGFLRKALSETLVFRRANGDAINRQEFLDDLERPENSFEYLISEDIRVVPCEVNAIVSLRVRAKGHRLDSPFEGTYRNVRIFEPQGGGEWQCVVWSNSIVGDAPRKGPDVGGEATYLRILGKPDEKDVVGLRKYTKHHLFAKIWNREALSDRDRRLITLSLLAFQGHRDQLKSHLRGAFKSESLSEAEVTELMIHVAHYGGWAAGTSGTEVALEVLKEFA